MMVPCRPKKTLFLSSSFSPQFRLRQWGLGRTGTEGVRLFADLACRGLRRNTKIWPIPQRWKHTEPRNLCRGLRGKTHNEKGPSPAPGPAQREGVAQELDHRLVQVGHGARAQHRHGAWTPLCHLLMDPTVVGLWGMTTSGIQQTLGFPKTSLFIERGIPLYHRSGKKPLDPTTLYCGRVG